jgi:tRNA(Ile)-lysidine synthase
MIEEVKTTIKRHDLLKRGDRVLVALSGGPDSVALLHIMASLAKGLRLQLNAVHINHGIRVEAGEREERFCQELCGKLGVTLHIERTDIPDLSRSGGKGIEETARDFRYEVFERLADQLGCNRIGLGHHADDQTETILFRILRGTGRTGLKGIPIKRGRYIRPLLEVNRTMILKYLDRHDVSYCVDESNTDLAYARNYLRHHLLAEIRENVNPAVDQALRNLVDSLDEEEAYLDQIVDKAIKRCVSLTIGGKLALDLNRLRTYAVWIIRRTLRRCLMAASGTTLAPDRAVVDRLERLIETGRGSLSVPGGLHAVLGDDRLFLYDHKVSRFAVDLDCGAKVTLPGLFAELRCAVAGYKDKQADRTPRAKRVMIDADKVKGPLLVRSIHPGDRIRPLGMRGTKKVGDYLTDRKVPAVLRDEIPVVCDSQSILWLVGFEISETVKIDRRTRKVIRLAYRELKTEKRHALRAATGSAEDS